MQNQKLRDVMTNTPIVLESDDPISTAAKEMKERAIGNVLVTKRGELTGILTDRDIVVRCIATGEDPSKTPVAHAASQAIAVLSPDDDVDTAVTLMRKKAIRRVPVVEEGRPIGIVSLGDLAEARQESSALGRISAAAANA